jgi:uncharacterized protein (TIGR02466 family)
MYHTIDKKIETIFPTVVVGYKNKNHLEMNSKILDLLEEEIFDISFDGICPDQTRNNHLEKVEKYSDFFDWIQICLDDYKNYFNLQTEKLKVSLSWVNRSISTSEHRVHCHPNSFISGIYYLNSKPAPTYFHSPVTSKRTGIVVLSDSILDSNIWQHPANAGELILFPSWLEHNTFPQSFEGYRYTISINVMPVGVTNQGINIENIY